MNSSPSLQVPSETLSEDELATITGYKTADSMIIRTPIPPTSGH